MGPKLLNGQLVQHYIPAGDWFAGYSLGEWSLVGCTVAPGFDFDDFEMGRRDHLLSDFPDHSLVIEKLAIDGNDSGVAPTQIDEEKAIGSF